MKIILRKDCNALIFYLFSISIRLIWSINRTFQAFFLQIAAVFVRLFQTAAVAQIIGMAPAGTVKARPAFHAGRLTKHMARLKITTNIVICDTFIDGAYFKFLIAHKLRCARVAIPLGLIAR